jgi:hypothetical protein
METSTPNNIASQPKLVNSVWPLGLSLSGVETQDLRQRTSSLSPPFMHMPVETDNI